MHFHASSFALTRLLPTVLVSLGIVAACSERREDNDSSAGPSASASPNDPGALGVDGKDEPVLPPDKKPDAGAPPKPSCSTPATTPEGGAFDVEVAIAPKRGPKGKAAPVPINRRLYGMNIADWEPANYSPSPRPAYANLLGALEPGVLRWPAGHRSQEYHWERGGPGQHGNWVLTAAHVDAFISLAQLVGAEPLVAINVKRGTEAAAKDLLRYMNVEKGYGVKYLQIGNEPDLTDDMTAGPQVYADQLIRFTDALRSVDPNIKIIGPEMLTGAHVGGMHGTVDWMTPILSQTAGRIHGISWHYYPLDSGQKSPTSSAIMSVENLFQEAAHDWRPAALAFVDEVMPALDQLRAAHAPNAEVWVTEIAEDPGPDAGTGISDTLAGALWVGDVIGRYGEYGPGAVLRWLFKGSTIHSYGLVDPFDVPRPAYGAYWMYARHFGDHFVDSTTSSITDVAVHASTKTDGRVAVVLVNKTTSPRRVKVAFDGFAPCEGEELTLTGNGYDAKTFTINGSTLTDTAAKAGVPLNKVDFGNLLDVELPPTSMRLVVYRP